MKFTVLGHYTDNEQKWSECVEADHARDAEDKALAAMKTANGWDDQPAYEYLDRIAFDYVIEGTFTVLEFDEPNGDVLKRAPTEAVFSGKRYRVQATIWVKADSESGAAAQVADRIADIDLYAALVVGDDFQDELDSFSASELVCTKDGPLDDARPHDETELDRLEQEGLIGPDDEADALTMVRAEVHWLPGDDPEAEESDPPGFVAFARMSDGTLAFPMGSTVHDTREAAEADLPLVTYSDGLLAVRKV